MGGSGRVGGGEVRVDVNEELKFLGEIHKKNFGGGGGGVGRAEGQVGGRVGGGGQGGCECKVGGRGRYGVWGM